MEERLVITDFSTQELNIHIYIIDVDMEVNEEFIKKLGHDPNYCQWFFGMRVNIQNHSKDEVIKILH